MPMMFVEYVVRADTAGQAQQAIQQVCSQSDASYERSDLAGYMRMYDVACRVTDVSGKDISYRQILARATDALSHAHKTGTLRTVISSVHLQDGNAYATAYTDFDFHRRDYTYIRKTVASTLWVKEPTGWRLMRLQMMTDTIRYQRNPPPPLT